MKKKFLYVIFLLVVFTGCEYERIAAPESECNSSEIELTVESIKNTACAKSIGEIAVVVNSTGQYEYRINDGDFVNNNVFNSLAAGNYRIQAIDLNTNCISEAIEVAVNNEDGIRISLLEQNNSECGENTGSISVAQEGGVEPIEYILNGGQAQNSAEFINLSNGNYSVLARDANGCEAEITGIDIMTSISFSNDIKPIIATNCAVSGCHNGSESPNLSKDENIIQNASRIRSRTSNGTMPPAGRQDLTENEIQAIACWVEDGALNN
ncbi:hypothetical protein [Marivirga sp.]|uniref:hypothetical protein n=1 Tax=Marivirga sp. TaxID=2018662 RepID=UPI002D7E84F9|nr:hypothetical protein [Marivirga sp.]HET8860851.1 hypothetical protein [Marivirga sp.]